MLRLLLLSLFTLALQAAEEHAAHMSEADITFYKWINFAVLIVGLGFLVAKFMIPALTQRANDIQKALVDSRKAVESSEARIAELNSKLGNFDAEVSSLKTRSLAERETEAKRIAEQTAALLAKLAEQRQAEIASSTKVAEAQLRSFAAAEALKLANAKLATRMNPELRSSLVSQFVAGLEQQSSNVGAN
jgi:F0F1-type ATP synthase membrane subunit b/b'